MREHLDDDLAAECDIDRNLLAVERVDDVSPGERAPLVQDVLTVLEQGLDVRIADRLRAGGAAERPRPPRGPFAGRA